MFHLIQPETKLLITLSVLPMEFINLNTDPIRIKKKKRKVSCPRNELEYDFFTSKCSNLERKITEYLVEEAFSGKILLEKEDLIEKTAIRFQVSSEESSSAISLAIKCMLINQISIRFHEKTFFFVSVHLNSLSYETIY